MVGRFRHVSYKKGCKIAVLRKEGRPLSQIAERPGRSQSTIFLEMRGNSGGRGYGLDQAQGGADERWPSVSAGLGEVTAAIWDLIVTSCASNGPRADRGGAQLKCIVSLAVQWLSCRTRAALFAYPCDGAVAKAGGSQPQRG